MKTKIVLASAILAVVVIAGYVGWAKAVSLPNTLSGMILIQVQDRGKAWYVSPKDKKRYYLGKPADAYAVMRQLGLGIKHQELQKYLASGFPSRLTGLILLDVESKGQAYYVCPKDHRVYSLGKAADALAIMRKLGLGISNENIAKIPVGTLAITPASGTATSANASGASQCLNNTKDEGQCKDCCDCLPGADGAARTACRDACMKHDFTKNSNLITVTAPSTLGAKGDYSMCTAAKDSGSCKACCEGGLGLQCGDYRFCRTACNDKFGEASTSTAPGTGTGTAPQAGQLPPQAAIDACTGKAVGATCQFLDKGATAQGVCDDKPGVLACKKNDATGGRTGGQQPPPSGSGTGTTSGGQGGYSIEQAISDKAQLNTLAFGGLGFLTGNTCSDSFLPPGKVADFFGFQYLRDVTQEGKGHSTDFVTNAANNVLSVLTATQKAKMIALAKTQVSLVNSFALKRFPLMVAFRRQLTGAIPSGSSGLSKTAIMQYSSDLYALDAQISIQRAQLFSDIIRSVSADQKAFLDKMVAGGFASWVSLPDQVDKTTLTHDQHVLVMTYASEMFGWYAGNVEADTYFCPERQGDYFGGFYIKDAPAMGNAGYTIDESITGDKGEAFINALDSVQKPIITNIVETQRTAINSIVTKRRAISTELRKALSGGTIDQALVMSLSREYGALDGEISYYYATAFSQVGKTLTAAQKANLVGIKDLENYTCPDEKAYLYSEKIDMPTVMNTDFLFGK